MKFENEIRQYTHVLDELPYAVISINNLGFVLFYNRYAEKSWRMKHKEVIGEQVKKLFHSSNTSQVIQSFTDPAKNKIPGIFPDQELVLPDGNVQRKELMLIRTDLKDELLFTLIVL